MDFNFWNQLVDNCAGNKKSYEQKEFSIQTEKGENTIYYFISNQIILRDYRVWTIVFINVYINVEGKIN